MKEVDGENYGMTFSSSTCNTGRRRFLYVCVRVCVCVPDGWVYGLT